MIYKVVGTGSSGNAIIYHNTIMVDCGVPYSAVKKYEKQLQIVLLTHEHLDHINIQTLTKLCFESPALRIACCEWMYDKVKILPNVDVLKVGKMYNYGPFAVSPVQLYHDVPNCGYRIIKGNHKTIHITDTSHVVGIEAKGYDLFMIEANYNEEISKHNIRKKDERGEFAYERRGINSHLSEDQAQDFFISNRKPDSEFVRLHETSGYI